MSGERPSWMTVALAAAGGFLAGVLLIAVLGGPKGTVRTETRTTARVETRTVTVDGRPEVPDVVGRSLPEARRVIEDAGFAVDVQDDTVFGILDERNYVVTEQTPEPGSRVSAGSGVTITVDRR